MKNVKKTGINNVDEFKRIVISNGKRPNHNQMVEVIGFQDFNQSVTMYGKDTAKVMYNSLRSRVVLRLKGS